MNIKRLITIAYQQLISDHSNTVPCPLGFKVQELAKFMGKDSRITRGFISQVIVSYRKADNGNTFKL